MSRCIHILLATLFLCLLPAIAADKREQFSTRSTLCAEAIDNAIRLSQEKKHAEALAQILIAVKEDPTCEMAHYWHHNILLDMGEFDKAIEVGTKVVDAARARPEGAISNIGVELAVDMGLSYAKIGKTSEASYWFSQGILLDLADRAKLQWKAYRNMAIVSMNSGDSLSALMQACKAKELAPTRVEDGMIRNLSKSFQRDQTCVNVLRFNKEPVQTQHAVRAEPVQVARNTELELKLEQGFPLAAIAPIPGTKSVCLLFKDQMEATLVDTGSGTVSKFQLSAPIGAATATSTGLYLCRAKEPMLELRSLEGNLLRTYSLPKVAVSVAVCPITQQAFLSISDEIQLLDLVTGKIKATDLIGQVVCVDAPHRVVYSTYKRPLRSESGEMIINGRLVFFSSAGDVFKEQNVIFKAAYISGGFTAIAAIRADAASNGYTLDVSRDGRWITVTGGGGYRGPGPGGGYGTGVLSAEDMAHLEHFYGINAYSQASAFNPVTDQLLLVSTGELKVFNLGADKEGFLDTGAFSSVARWSPDGSWLFVGNTEKGLRVYRNTVTSADEKLFASISRPRSAPSQPAATSSSDAASPKMPSLLRFTPASTLAAAKTKAAAGAKSTTTKGPPYWRDVPAYSTDLQLQAKIGELLSEFKPQEAGLAIYQFKEILKEKPGFVPATFGLAFAYSANNNTTEVIPLLLDVVHADAGQSALTSEALCLLAKTYLKKGLEAEALDCLGTSLLVDKDHPTTVLLAAPLMEKHGILFQVPAGFSQPEPASPSVIASASGAPKLNWPSHRKSARALSAEELFAFVAECTVSIKTDSGYGSGVFISDDGYILTSEHVVQGRHSSVDVTLFALTSGKVEKSGMSPASVVFADRESDIALLKIGQPPSWNKGLALSKDTPRTGMKVFAIGSPGLGERLLEQSLTEGIISSNQRLIDGKTWLQHSAAVNAGNSGGPLVSQYGEIIGIVSLKTDLENVGFAVPAARIREILNQPPGD